MLRLLVSLLLAAPLGCATNKAWLSEFDTDPDLRTDWVRAPRETTRATTELQTDTQIRTDSPPNR